MGRATALALVVAASLVGVARADSPFHGELLPDDVADARLAAALTASDRRDEALAIYDRLGESVDVPLERRVEYRAHANELARALGKPEPYGESAASSSSGRWPLWLKIFLGVHGSLVLGACAGVVVGLMVDKTPSTPSSNIPIPGSFHGFFGELGEQGEHTRAVGRRTRGAGAMLTAVRF
jgi:hypothetical protein